MTILILILGDDDVCAVYVMVQNVAMRVLSTNSSTKPSEK